MSEQDKVIEEILTNPSYKDNARDILRRYFEHNPITYQEWLQWFRGDPKWHGFDNYEVHPIDKDGNNLTGEGPGYVESEVHTWSVFGHMIEGGIECIADFYDKNRAFEYYEALMKGGTPK